MPGTRAARRDAPLQHPALLPAHDLARIKRTHSAPAPAACCRALELHACMQPSHRVHTCPLFAGPSMLPHPLHNILPLPTAIKPFKQTSCGHLCQQQVSHHAFHSKMSLCSHIACPADSNSPAAYSPQTAAQAASACCCQSCSPEGPCQDRAEFGPPAELHHTVSSCLPAVPHQQPATGCWSARMWHWVTCQRTPAGVGTEKDRVSK